jgi:hypothetical protein
MRLDLRHLVPRDANAPSPAASAEERDDLEGLARTALEPDVVDLAAAPAFGVDQLVIEHVETEIDRILQFWPTFVRIISGIAAKEMSKMTPRYSTPSVLATRPFAYSRM